MEPLTILLGTCLAPLEEVNVHREAHLAFLAGVQQDGPRHPGGPPDPAGRLDPRLPRG